MPRRQRRRHGQGPHDTGQLVQRGALPSRHVRVGDAQAAQPGSQVRDARRSTALCRASCALDRGAGGVRRAFALGRRRLLGGSCPSLVALRGWATRLLLEDHVVFASGGRSSAWPPSGGHRLTLGDAWLLRGDGLRFRTRRGSVESATPLPSRSRVNAACASARTWSNASAGIASDPRDT